MSANTTTRRDFIKSHAVAAAATSAGMVIPIQVAGRHGLDQIACSLRLAASWISWTWTSLPHSPSCS